MVSMGSQNVLIRTRGAKCTKGKGTKVRSWQKGQKLCHYSWIIPLFPIAMATEVVLWCH